MAVKAAGNIVVIYNTGDITEYVDSGGIAASIAELDSTDLASTAMEYTPGLADWTYSTNVNNWDSVIDGILMPDLVTSGALRTLSVAFTDATAATVTYTWTDSVFITSGELGGEATALVGISGLTFRCGGAPTRVVT